jgi:hypothetical protein
VKDTRYLFQGDVSRLRDRAVHSGADSGEGNRGSGLIVISIPG